MQTSLGLTPCEYGFDFMLGVCKFDVPMRDTYDYGGAYIKIGSNVELTLYSDVAKIGHYTSMKSGNPLYIPSQTTSISFKSTTNTVPNKDYDSNGRLKKCDLDFSQDISAKTLYPTSSPTIRPNIFKYFDLSKPVIIGHFHYLLTFND